MSDPSPLPHLVDSEMMSDPSTDKHKRRRLAEKGSETVYAWVTADVENITGLNASNPVNAVFFVANQDLAGAGSTSTLSVSGSQIDFSLVQDGTPLDISNLKQH